jgi:hypothetical protein
MCKYVWDNDIVKSIWEGKSRPTSVTIRTCDAIQRDGIKTTVEKSKARFRIQETDTAHVWKM